MTLKGGGGEPTPNPSEQNRPAKPKKEKVGEYNTRTHKTTQLGGPGWRGGKRDYGRERGKRRSLVGSIAVRKGLRNSPLAGDLKGPKGRGRGKLKWNRELAGRGRVETLELSL